MGTSRNVDARPLSLAVFGMDFPKPFTSFATMWSRTIIPTEKTMAGADNTWSASAHGWSGLPAELYGSLPARRYFIVPYTTPETKTRSVERLTRAL